MLALMLAAALAGTVTQEPAGPALPIEALRDAAPDAFRHWRAAMAGRSRERKGRAFLRLARAAPPEFAEVMVYMSTARGEQAAVLLRDAPMEFLAVLAAPPGSGRATGVTLNGPVSAETPSVRASRMDLGSAVLPIGHVRVVGRARYSPVCD